MKDKIVITNTGTLKQKLQKYANNLSITPTAAAKVILSRELNKE